MSKKVVDDLMELASEAVDSHLRFAIEQALAEATLVERERCAKVCDKWVKANHVYVNGAIQCAAEIRKGETT